MRVVSAGESVVKRFFVVDQNYLRSNDLKGLLQSQGNSVIVFPDIALLEMLKTDQWKSTMQRSLRILSSVPQRVYISISIGVAMRKELDSGRMANGHMIDRPATKWFRVLLREIATGREGASIEAIAKKILVVQRQVMEDELNGEANKERLQNLIQTLQPPVLSEELLKDFRANRVIPDQRRKIIADATPYVLKELFKEAQFSDNKAKVFLKQRPTVLRNTYSKLWLCLSWLARGGIETAKVDTITNDVIDQEYVITATFFDGILSKEPRVNDAFDDLSAILCPSSR